MPVPRTVGILQVFNGFPEPIRVYLEHFPRLAEDYPWEVSLSYLFAQIELAQNMIVYGGVVKLHKVDSEIAKSAVNSHRMTRERFRSLYKDIVGEEIPEGIVKLSKQAEGVRDQILHGKPVLDEKKRQAVVSALEYANQLNEEVFMKTDFRPFGKMRGFKGRAKSLDKPTSRWVLKGIGIISSPKKAV